MKQERQHRRFGRRRIRAVAIAFVAVIAVLLVTLTLSPGERLLRRIVEGRLGAFLGQAVTIGYLETNLVSRFEIADVRVYQVQDADTIPSLHLGSARLVYTLRDLIRRRFTIHSLTADSLFLAVARDSFGTWNFPFLKEKPGEDTSASEGSALAVSLGQADLTRATLHYTDRSAPQVSIVVDGLRVAVKGAADQHYAYRLWVDSVAGVYTGIPLSVTDIDLAGAWVRDRLMVDSLDMSVLDLAVAGHARIQLTGGPGSLTGQIRIRGNPGTLIRSVAEQAADTAFSASGLLDMVLNLTGSLEEPRVGCDLGISNLAVAGLSIAEVSMRASAQQDTVRVDEMHVMIMDGRVDATATVLLDSLLSFETALLVDRIQMDRIWQMVSHDSSPYQGSINGKVTVSGGARSPESWDLVGDVSVAGTKYRGTSVPGLAVRLRFKDGEGNLAIEQGDSRITAVAALHDRSLDGRFTVRVPDLEPLSGMFLPDVAGQVTGHGFLYGPLDSLLVGVDIDSASVTYRNFPVDSIRGGIRYEGGVVSLAGLTFGGSLSPMDTLRPPLGMTGAAGSMSYSGHVSGPVDRVSGALQASLSEFRYGKLRLDEGSLSILLDEGRVGLEALRLRRDSLMVLATGTYLIPSASGQIDLHLYELAGDERASGEGQSDEPAGRMRVDVAAGLAGSVVASFDLSNGENIAASLAASGIRLNVLNTVLTGDTTATGILNLNAGAWGPLGRPEGRLAFGIEGPGYRSVHVDSVTGLVHVADREIRVEPVCLYLGQRAHTVSAVLALEAEGGTSYGVSDRSRFRGWARGDELDLSLFGLLLPENARVGGLVSYDVRWDGTLRAPHPNGRIDLRGGGIELRADAPAVRDVNLTVALMDSVISVDTLTGIIKDTPFRAEALIESPQWHDFDVDAEVSLGTFGQMSARGNVSPESLDLNVRIDQLRLGIFEPLSPEIVQLSGILTTGISLTGPVRSPSIRGLLSIRGFSIETRSVRPPVTEGIVTVRFDDKTANIDSIFARMGKGYALISGHLTRQNGQLADASVAIRMADLEFERPGIVEGVVESADLIYTGGRDRYVLEGDIVMGTTRFVMDFDPRSVLPFARSVRKPEQEMPALLKDMGIDVRLRDSKDLWVDNNVARIRSHAELNIIGTPPQPNVTGRLYIAEGYVKFLDRKFEMTKGTVDFAERDHLNPIIDLRAESKVKTYKALQTTAYTVHLDIVGPLDKVRVDLTSDPPLDRANILSLLTLGITRDQLADTGEHTPSTGEILKVRAEEITSRVVSGYVSGSVADLVGLKDLSIEGNLFNPRGAQGAFLVASKDLSDRVDITYSTNIGHFNQNMVKMDYRLSRRFLLQGETDQQGKAGIDLKYRIRFR
jgi:autotransporter translocation and assembly factor TamB